MATKQGKIITRISKIDTHLKMIISICTSVIAVITALVAGFTYVTTQVNTIIDERVDMMEQQLKKQLNEQQQAITRIELMALIKNDPTNKVEIEKLARHYFVDLNGNQYMSGYYSDWANKYNGDIELVIVK